MKKLIYPIAEHAHTINGVAGTMSTVHAPQEVRGTLVHRNQTWRSAGRAVKGYGTAGMMHVCIRFDDECGNGHQTFSITADVYTEGSRRHRDIAAGGCLHNKIAKRFPELKPLIKWHLSSTDGPLHYVANTTYLAGNRDHNGLLKGESSQIRNGRTGQPCWILERTPGNLPQYVDRDTQPTEQVLTKYVPLLCIGEGKERDFEAARSCAVWPEATNEQLSLPKEELAELLAARLPGLIAAFRVDMDNIGMSWEPTPC